MNSDALPLFLQEDKSAFSSLPSDERHLFLLIIKRFTLIRGAYACLLFKPLIYSRTFGLACGLLEGCTGHELLIEDLLAPLVRPLPTDVTGKLFHQLEIRLILGEYTQRQA